MAVPIFYSLGEVEAYIADNTTLVFGEILVRGVQVTDAIRMIKLLEGKQHRDEWDVVNIHRVRDVASFAYSLGNFIQVLSGTCHRLDHSIGGITAAAARVIREQSPTFRKLVIGDSGLLMFLGFADALISLGEEMTLVAEDEEEEEEGAEDGEEDEEGESNSDDEEGQGQDAAGPEIPHNEIVQGRLLLPRLNQMRGACIRLTHLIVTFDTLSDGPAVQYEGFGDFADMFPIAPEPVPAVNDTQENLTLAAAGTSGSKDEDNAPAPLTVNDTQEEATTGTTESTQEPADG